MTMTNPESTLLTLPIDSIRPSTTNPRRHFDPIRMQDLVASIRQSGIKQPLLVRPMFDPDDGDLVVYELVAGERRLRAAREAGLAEVPCISREMTDAEARETQIVENLQRADVHPVEEAEAFNTLLEDLGSIAAVAAKLGKEQSYVAKCLRLLSLTLCSRDALRGGLITIEHGLLLARLAEAEQNAALKWTLDRNAGVKVPVDKVLEERLAERKQYEEDRKAGELNHWSRRMWECESVVRLREYIEGAIGIKLSRAPWSLTDEDYLLPDVGPCAECPKNTKANVPLFEDLDISEPTCTDGACFAAKVSGFVHIEMRKAGHDETAKPKVLVPRLSWKVSSVKPSIVPNDLKVIIGTPGRCGETANPAKVLKYGQWLDVKKGSCPNVRPGITADWSDSGDRGYNGGNKKLRMPGETILVCIAVGCKVHPKGWEKQAKSSNDNHAERHDPAEEKRKLEERDFLETKEGEIRSKVFWAILGNLTAATAIHRIADEIHGAAAARKEILAAFPGIGGEQLEAYVVFSDSFQRIAEANGYWLMQPGGVEKDRKDLWALAKSVGVDANAVAAKYFHDAGSIAALATRLYPKGVKWPKDVKGGPAPVKKPVVKKPAAKKAAKTAKKPAAKKKGASK